jgi:hypothetical protein
MAQDFRLKDRCRMCDGSELRIVMSLAPTPPGNNFLREQDLGKRETSYPLELHLCMTCSHVQLGHVVDPRILYQNDYPYVSATSAVFVQHLRDYANDMVARFGLPAGSLVADIGSNDGTCLGFFKQLGMNVVGIDPATQIAARATAAGIPTVADFFSHELARRLRREHGPARFITSHNACAHIDRLDDVMRGVAHWLAEDGLFVLEVGYLVDVYSNLWFDTIYHEHLDYHTVAPFRALFARTGLEMIAVQRVSPQGGSIRVMAQKAGGNRSPDSSIEECIALERQLGLHQPESFQRYRERIESVGARLRGILEGLRRDGRSLAAFGATTKGTTLLSTFGIGAGSIAFIVDDNPLKQGLYSPRLHIPVVGPERLHQRRPDYLLILAWNFAEPIMAKLSTYAAAGGRFIIPMPDPRIV